MKGQAVNLSDGDGMQVTSYGSREDFKRTIGYLVLTC